MFNRCACSITISGTYEDMADFYEAINVIPSYNTTWFLFTEDEAARAEAHRHRRCEMDCYSAQSCSLSLPM